MSYLKVVLKSLTCVVMALVLNTSCKKDEIILSQSIGTADFVVRNLSTGKEISGGAIVIGNTDYLEISEGDELELSYTPSQDYKDYTFNVTFSICGKNVSTAVSTNGTYTANYTMPNVSVDNYTLLCTANGESGNRLFQETGYVYAKVTRNSTQITDAGSFVVKNISSGKDVDLSHGISLYIGTESAIADCYGGDTLLVKFTPKTDYSQYKFKVSVPDYKQINDSLFVVPTEETTDDKYRGKAIALNASCIADGKTLSAKEEGLFSYKSFFSYTVEWVIGLSEDLHRFVQPEFTCVDVDGKETTKVLSDSDLKRDYFALYLDAEDNYHFLRDETETPEDDWTLDGLIVTYEYRSEARFTRRNSTLKAQVRYRRRDGAELTDTDVEFSRSLNWYASGYINLGMTITTGSNAPTVEKLQKYLDDCCEATDEKIISIDMNGHISEGKK